MSTNDDITRSYDAADGDWKERALRIVFEVACDNPTFTPDDIWLSGLDHPREPRALGGVIRKAVAMGICEQDFCSHCGQPMRTNSVRESRNDNVVNIWKSLVYEATQQGES